MIAFKADAAWILYGKTQCKVDSDADHQQESGTTRMVKMRELRESLDAPSESFKESSMSETVEMIVPLLRSLEMNA